MIAFNKYYNKFNILSVSLVIVSLLLLTFKGLNFGIDFKGGTLIELRSTDTKINVSSLRDNLSQMNLGDVSVKNFGNETDFLIKFENNENKNVVEEIKNNLDKSFGNSFNFRRVENVGPKVSAELLRSGALPAPLNIIEERTVGPDLGQDSINAGMIALLIGFILVILYIFVKYKIFGIITNIALILNLFILVGILTIFEATLTLPGIAGIILTVGMAVDANVLIFERIKEELKSEKNNLIAFDSGYTKSRTAILDANITTLLAAIILFFMGSGPIKGFSLTLGIGIFTTLFTVYFIARLLTVLYVSKNKEKEGLI